MKKHNLNEDVSDLLNIDDTNTNIDDMFKTSGKRKKRTVEVQEIIIPEPLVNDLVNEKIAIKNQQNSLEHSQQRVQEIVASKNQISSDTEQKIVNEELKEHLENIKKEELPAEVDYIRTKQEIDEANDNIAEVTDIVDLDFKKVVKSDKTGYYKTTVKLKKENIPLQISTIASIAKGYSKGLIAPRVCDLRVIGNTNKTQLKTFKLKLTAATVVFKPNPKKMKIKKFHRFMISIPDNYDEEGILLIYMQDGRKKTIFEIDSKPFPDVDTFNKYIAKRIANYYTLGYDVTLKKFQLNGKQDPLMELIKIAVGSHDFKAKPYTDDTGNIFAVDFYTKGANNQWLIVQVIDSDEYTGMYDIYALSKVDETFKGTITREPNSINKLMKNILDILVRCYERDWSKLIGSDPEAIFLYQYGKLKHAKLRVALTTIYDYGKDHPELSITLKKTLNKQDVEKKLNENYDAEAAIYTVNNGLEYFILTYYAHQLNSGDKRSAKEYIDNENYYDKYKVADRREGIERVKEDRNYHARKYLFQVEYLVSGEKEAHIYRDFDIESLLTNTGIITNNVLFPESLI